MQEEYKGIQQELNDYRGRSERRERDLRLRLGDAEGRVAAAEEANRLWVAAHSRELSAAKDAFQRERLDLEEMIRSKTLQLAEAVEESARVSASAAKLQVIVSSVFF